MFKKTILNNGITVLTETIPHIRSVSVGVWLKKGSRHEPPRLNGIYHFIEHMVFKGTKNRSAAEIAFEMDAIGGQFDALTAKEYTCFNFRVLDEHLPTALELTSDIILNPTFKSEHMKRERMVIAEEIKMVEDSPEDLAQRLFVRNFYDGHPLGRPITGTVETLSGITEDVIFEHFRSSYIPDNIIISLAGKLDHDKTVEMLEDRFSGLNGRKDAGAIEKPVENRGILLKSKEGIEQAHMILGGRCFKQNHPLRYAMHTVNTMLGGTMSSRLFQRVREEKGLVYSIYSFANPYMDSGYYAVYAGTGRDSVKTVLHVVMEELRALKNGEATEEELENAKNNLKGSLMLSFESSIQRMTRIALQEYYFGRYESLDGILKKIESVTLEDAEEAARRLFKSGGFALLVLGGSGTDELEIDSGDLQC